MFNKKNNNDIIKRDPLARCIRYNNEVDKANTSNVYQQYFLNKPLVMGDNNNNPCSGANGDNHTIVAGQTQCIKCKTVFNPEQIVLFYINCIKKYLKDPLIIDPNNDLASLNELQLMEYMIGLVVGKAAYITEESNNRVGNKDTFLSQFKFGLNYIKQKIDEVGNIYLSSRGFFNA